MNLYGYEKTSNGLTCVILGQSDLPVGVSLTQVEYDSFSSVPPYYLLIDAGAVREMTQPEKDAQGIILLSNNKQNKIEEIDAKTGELIAAGFTFDGEQFSLSAHAQRNWLGLKTLKDIITWPKDITRLDDDTYSLVEDGALGVDAFVGTALATYDSHLATGRALKHSVNIAADQAALGLVVDNR